MKDYKDYFAKMEEQDAARVRGHQRSAVHNQVERVRVGIQEAGDDELTEDFEVLETLIDKLIELALPE